MYRSFFVIVIVPVWLITVSHSASAFQLSDQTPINNKTHKALVEIYKQMAAVSDSDDELSGAKIEKHCKAINNQFSLVKEKEVPKEIAAEFKEAKNRFGDFYRQFQEVKDKDIAAIQDHVQESARAYGQSWERLIQATKKAGFDVETRSSDVVANAKSDSTKVKLKMLIMACRAYKLDVGKFPAKLEDLVKAPHPEKNGRKWRGPYVDSTNLKFEDAWGTKISLQFNMETNKHEIISAGQDKKFGTEDDIKN